MSDEMQALARITPGQRMVMQTGLPTGAVRAHSSRMLSAQQKAAVIVRYLIAEGAQIPLSQLPEPVQQILAEQMGEMRLVDRQVLDQVLEEFLAQLDSVGLAFSGGLEGALSLMDGQISPSAASRVRRKAGMNARHDPWGRLIALPVAQLLPVIEDEAVEVSAVVLSKLAVAKAADLLGRLPGEKARRIAFAVSLTGNIDPETVRRIGIAVLNQIDSRPARAFTTGPVERVGAILNVSAAGMREEVLQGLEAEDASFAEEVRKAIFTWAHIPARIAPRDVPKIIRSVDQLTIVTAMAYAIGRPQQEEASEFLLSHISQRMAQGLREEVTTRGKVKERQGEEAMNAVINAIRELEANGELEMVTEGEAE